MKRAPTRLRDTAEETAHAEAVHGAFEECYHCGATHSDARDPSSIAREARRLAKAFWLEAPAVAAARGLRARALAPRASISHVVASELHSLHHRAMNACEKLLAARRAGDLGAEYVHAQFALHLETRAHQVATAAGVSESTLKILARSVATLRHDVTRLRERTKESSDDVTDVPPFGALLHDACSDAPMEGPCP